MEAALIAPEISQAINERIAERRAEETKKLLRSVIENGFASMTRGKPRERLMGYMTNTYDTDEVLLLDTPYLELRKRGEEVPPTKAEDQMAAYVQQMEAQQRALEMGMDPKLMPPLDEPLRFWATVLGLPFGVEWAEMFANDWRKLRNQEAKRREAEVGA